MYDLLFMLVLLAMLMECNESVQRCFAVIKVKLAHLI